MAKEAARDRRSSSRRTLFAVASAILLAAAVWAQREPSIPAPRGFVNDFAGVIDANTARRLDNLIRELKEKTGSEIAVVTVPTTQPLSAFDYAMKVAEAWKPGAAGKDNGVVFLVAVQDRELFILTGYGIEGALPDGKVGEIRDRTVVPRFRSGDYGAGIRGGVEALAAEIAAEYNVTLDGVVPRVRTTPPIGSLVPLIVILIILVIIIRSGGVPMVYVPRNRGRHWGGGFGGGGFGGSSGGFGGGDGGGFGGFGGGGFGGGGAGGRW